ncbi:hypothetical protein AAVH_15408 [Aphelenchoides avenae]|nr:hypothetical protein AAVH_15408 [Aphelenchus avenae]
MAEARTNEQEQWEKLQQQADEILPLPADGTAEAHLSAADERELLQETEEAAAAKTLSELQLVEKLVEDLKSGKLGESSVETTQEETPMEMEKETESAPVEAPASASEPADAAYENLSPEPVEPPPATTAPASLPAPLAVHAPAVMPPLYTPPVYSAFQPVGQPGQPMQFMVPPPDMHIAHALAAQPWALSAIIAALKPHIPDPATFGNQGFESQGTSQVRVSDRGFFGSTGLGDSGNTQEAAQRHGKTLVEIAEDPTSLGKNVISNAICCRTAYIVEIGRYVELEHMAFENAHRYILKASRNPPHLPHPMKLVQVYEKQGIGLIHPEIRLVKVKDWGLWPVERLWLASDVELFLNFDGKRIRNGERKRRRSDEQPSTSSRAVARRVITVTCVHCDGENHVDLDAVESPPAQ